jgi:hypothetical protein
VREVFSGEACELEIQRVREWLAFVRGCALQAADRVFELAELCRMVLVRVSQGSAGARASPLYRAVDDVFVDDVGGEHREQSAHSVRSFAHLVVASLIQIAYARHVVEKAEADGFVNRAVQIEALHWVGLLFRARRECALTGITMADVRDHRLEAFRTVT